MRKERGSPGPRRRRLLGLLAAWLLLLGCAGGYPRILRERRGEFVVLSVDDGTPEPEAGEADLARGFLLFRRHYLRPVYPNTRPRAEELLRKGDVLRIRAAPGEFEPVALGVYPLAGLRRFSVSAGDLAGPGGELLARRRSLDVRLVQYTHLPVGPARLRQCRAFPKDLHHREETDIPKGMTRQYWITVKVPDDAAPGLYTGRIAAGHGRSWASVPLEVEVLPFRLRSPPGIDFAMVYESAFREIGWLSDGVQGDAFPEDPAALSRGRIVYQDFKDHGMTAVSPVCHIAYREKANGDPYLPDAEAALAEAKRAGLMGPAVCVFNKLLRTEKRDRHCNYLEYDPAAHPAQARKIAAYLTAKAKENGWPLPVLSAVDEPADPERIAIAVELYRAIQEAGGTTHLACARKWSEGPLPFVDIVNYNCADFDPEEAERVRKTGKKAWIYCNDSILSFHAAKSRWIYGLFGWRAPLDGVTTWTYHLKVGVRWREDVLGRRAPDFDPEDGRPVSCREWEAIREGIDDRRYLATLEALIEEARGRGKEAAAAPAARFLAGLRERIAPDLGPHRFISRETGELRHEGLLAPEEMEACRSRIVGEILELKEALEDG